MKRPDELKRLRQENATLRSLYDASKPLHERRKWPTAYTGPNEISDFLSQGFWPNCVCVECRAIDLLEQEHSRANSLDSEVSRLSDQLDEVRQELSNVRAA